jgi:hypothetical protein
MAPRARDGRLRTMFLEAPDRVIEDGAAITKVSAAHDIGFADRTENAATSPLVFLGGANVAHFVFAKEGDPVTVAGVPAVQVAFAEHGEPAFVAGPSGQVPLSGGMWVDPRDGAILKTVVRWQTDDTSAEITVTYARASDGSMWVPAEMVEVYTAGSARLECMTKFSNYRRYAAE